MRKRPSVVKRKRERRLQEKRQVKAEKRAERQRARKDLPDVAQDPDIAGIVPGPQPLPWDQENEPAEDDQTEEEAT